MTAGAVPPPAVTERQPGRARASLYAPLGWGIVRAPLLAVEARDAAGKTIAGSLLPRDARVRAARGGRGRAGGAPSGAPPAVELLDSLAAAGRLERTIAEICRSHVHLHTNRLLGSEPEDEQLVLELLRRTRDGLERSPVGE